MDLLLKNGIIFGQTALDIYRMLLDKKEVNFNAQTIHLKIESNFFDQIKHTFDKIYKKSNCLVKVTINNINFFISKTLGHENQLKTTVQIMVNGIPYKLQIENILDVYINILLEPLLELRKCKDLNEALIYWSLNRKLMYKFNHKKDIKIFTLQIDHVYVQKKLSWFLTCNNIRIFVPKKFLKKVQILHKSKKKNLSYEFMDILTNINNYFNVMVQKFYKKENIENMEYFNLTFPLQLYIEKSKVYGSSNRKSIFLTKKKNSAYVNLKTFAVLFYLRWFFNTIYNNKCALGFDGEYGRSFYGTYGQTFHKYDDVLLWLITHPNAIEDAELVVLDHIPIDYIF